MILRKSVTLKEKEKERMMTKILLCGASLSGNADGRAILDTVVEGILERVPNAEFTILCKYPKDDIPLCQKFGYKAYAWTTVQQILWCIPFYFFGRLLPMNPQKLPMPKALRSYFQHDIMVDLTGISFCDDRPFSSLLINTLWFLPALISKIPTVKIANSMGPFRKSYVRRGAELVLPTVDVLIARGDISYRLTREVFPAKQIYNLPDVAFCLTPCREERIEEILRTHGLSEKKYAVLGPSYVVNGLAGQERNLSVFAAAAEVIGEQTSLSLLLVPHSRAHSKTMGVDSTSDDVNVCRALQKYLAEKGIQADVLDEILDAHELKGVIGKAELVIASRYHLLIASVSSCVPSMALGWSHKYEEMFHLFDCETWVITHEQFEQELVRKKTTDFCGSIKEIKARLTERMPKVCSLSHKNIELICERLEG